MKKNIKKPIIAILILLIIPIAAGRLNGKGHLIIHINGPSYSKHFWEMDPYLINWHLGVGVECSYPVGRHWRAGLHSHYMIKDSTGLTAWWGGAACGYLIGDPNRFWMQPELMIGIIKKQEYFQGTPSFFGLPFLSVGYNLAGLNLVFIPKVFDIPCPILMVQIKLRVSGTFFIRRRTG